MFEKILVPLDMSRIAEQVIPHVSRLAGAFNSEVHVIHICEPHREDEIQVCRNYMEGESALIKSGLNGQQAKVKSILITGSPDHKIIEYAQKEGANLIVMASHGRSGVLLWPIGSTADKVLRRTPVPMIIVRAKETAEAATQSHLFQKILVPLDGSETGAKVLDYAVGLASRFNSEITLIHVVDTDRRVHSLGRLDTVPIREEDLGSLKKRAEDYLQQQARLFTGIGVRTVVKTGNVAHEIIKYAAQDGSTLIALSSHGHSGFESWIIGSVTTKILHAGQNSVLFAPATGT